eukprot:Em0011g181a
METASVTAALVTKVTQDTPVVAPPPSYNVSSRERSNATARIGTYCEECKCSVPAPLPPQSCEVIYELDRYVTGLEGNVYVVLDTTQKNYATLRGNGDCNPSQVIWPIPVGIVLGIIVVGVIALILWKACSQLGEFLEYKQWEKSLREETNRSGSNPLFVDPTSSYSNPRYNARS